MKQYFYGVNLTLFKNHRIQSNQNKQEYNHIKNTLKKIIKIAYKINKQFVEIFILLELNMELEW